VIFERLEFFGRDQPLEIPGGELEAVWIAAAATACRRASRDYRGESNSKKDPADAPKRTLGPQH
jgi:hypothetical protein